MSELATPVDKLSRLPLPILPHELLTNNTMKGPEKRAFFNTNFHHHFHPAKSEILEDIGGQALRFCRGQDVEKYLHNRYHNLFVGPELPIDNESKFRTTVLSCAGVIPPKAIDLSEHGDYEIIELNKKQYRRLVSSATVHIERDKRGIKPRNKIGHFFAEYALSHDLEEVVSKKVIDKFLSSRSNPDKRRELGNLILKASLNTSINEILPLHQELIDEGYEKTISLHPRELVTKFFVKARFPEYYATIEDKLTAT